MNSLLKHVGAIAVLVILTGSLTQNVLLYRQVKALKSDPAYVASKANDTLVSAVRRLMILPDETPTIATVDDPEKLKGQAFFERAKKGDKVLIFTSAKKAVLYDPVADKIVESAPLSATNAAASAPHDAAAEVSPDAGAPLTTTPAIQKKSVSKTGARAGVNVHASEYVETSR